jgi:murein DD-endopeptidase MepM/ murein hydrolase activator NlpD
MPRVRTLQRRIVTLAFGLSLCALCYAVALAQHIPLTNALKLETAMLIGARPSSGPLIPIIGDGRAHLAYELYLTNYGRKPARIVSLNVHSADGAAFATTIDRDALKSAFTPAAPPSRLTGYDPLLAPGASGVLYVFLDFPGTKAPRRLASSIVVEAEGEPHTAQRIVLDDLSVRASGAAVIDEPFSGDRWLAVNGPSNTSLHRRAVIVLNGTPRIPERYAIDFIKLGDDGNGYSGDEHKNASYHAYNTPILAVADGTVLTTTDGLPENVPHSDKLAVTLTLTSLPGNNVVENIGRGLYVGYAHLIPGTLTVKPGDHVHRGQVLGRLGNSGNSTEPHLHIQVCNGPSFMMCEGVPMEFKRITRATYRIDKQGETPIKLHVTGRQAVEGQEPMEDELVSFPAGN